jgi:phosphoglycolate phosphatase
MSNCKVLNPEAGSNQKKEVTNFEHKELLIFDLDGTLINSIPDLTLAINKTLSHYKLSALTIEEVTPFIGNGAKTLVFRALKKATGKEVSKEFLNEALTYFIPAYQSNVCEETYLYPHVLETLKYLHNKGYKLVICTNKPFDFVEPILEKLAIKKFFLQWIGEASLPEKKPQGAPLLYLAKQTNTPTDKCIMIGDSKNDILAAQNAGMESIGLTYGYNYNENIADHYPTIVSESFSNLQKVF